MLRFYVPFVSILILANFSMMYAKTSTDDRLYTLVKNGDSNKVKAFIKKKYGRARMDLYDKALEYARSTESFAMIKEISTSKAQEIEKREKGGFFKRHPIIARISLVGVTTFVSYIIITPLIVLLFPALL